MDAKQEQGTPPQSTSHRQITIYSSSKLTRRKMKSSKLRLSQIHKKPPEPEPTTDLVLYDKSTESTSCRQKKPVVNNGYDNSESKSSAMEQAEEVRANLEAEFPSFAKTLVRSNVTVGFWMHLPMRFCKLHLPKNDATVFLETESGEEYITNYIAERTALSGGWKAFCGTNKLAVGDVLIFHLVKPLRFKVYIVRGNGSVKADEELGDDHEKQINSDDQAENDIESHKKAKHLELVPLSILHEDPMILDMKKGHLTSQSENDENRDSKALEVIQSSGSIVNFEDVKGIENFSILVNGFAVDSELSDLQRTKYYELCCSQNSFLHENLLKSINYKLAAEIIIGTVDISEAIRASKLSGSHADYAVWDKTLKGFELLGMNVGFLHARLDRLMSIAIESEEAVESACRELRLEQARIDEEVRSLELKLVKLKESREMLDSEIESLKANAERHELIFQEVVNAPW